MRKVFLCLAFVSVFALLTGVASAQKKEPPKSNDLPAAAFNCNDTPTPNIVMDCRFDSGVFLPNWLHTGDTSSSSPQMGICGHSGDWCAHMGPVFYLGQLTQVLTTTPGQNYTLSFWVRNTGLPSDFEVWWGNFVTPLQSKLSPVPNFPYTQFTYAVTASQASTPLTFVFYNVPSWVDLTDVAVF